MLSALEKIADYIQYGGSHGIFHNIPPYSTIFHDIPQYSTYRLLSQSEARKPRTEHPTSNIPRNILRILYYFINYLLQ